MIVLGFDTSTTLCSIGIIKDGRPIDSANFDSKDSHSLHLMPMVDTLLHANKIEKTDVGLVSVGCGPGSFTGIRIAVTTAKTMAFAMNIPCLCINSLDAMAHCFADLGDFLCPMIDARKQEIYWRIYQQFDGKPQPRSDVQLGSIQEVCRQCAPGTVFCGSGAVTYKDLLLKNYGNGLRIAPVRTLFALGLRIAELGLLGFEQGLVPDPLSLRPLYIRKPEAEISRDKRTQEIRGEKP